MKTQYKFDTFLKFVLGLSLVLVISCKKEGNQLIAQSTNQYVANQASGIYPHTDEFKHSPLHGTMFFQNRASCTKCHGTDFKGGNVGVACSSCHNYPHTTTWAQPQNHGTYFAKMLADQAKKIKDPLKRDVKECMMCHENKMNPMNTFKERHPEQFVACSSCHADVPHGQKFLPSQPGENGPVAHDVYIEGNPDLKGSCFSCHLNKMRMAPKPVKSCLKCHEGPPFENAPDPAPAPEPTPSPSPSPSV